VHGFRGNGIETWSNGTSYWPDMIVKDRDYDGVDVFTYEYPTSFTDNLTLDEIAGNMHAVLQVNGVTDRQQIIFIAHSMGGVIVRDYLINNPEIANKTAFIQFLSTPTDGSSLANLAVIFNNPQLAKLTIDIERDYLGILSRQWASQNLQKIPSYCAYET
jgi:triacylglycerol esterase/lipase EstA (alpha/beta hydrolase family)